MTVRKALEKDAGTIVQFNCAMALETEGKTLDSDVVMRGVRSLFQNPQYGFYLVAEVEESIAGQLMVTYEWSDWRNGLFWWIQSVYILRESRRQGVFKALYEFVLTECKNSNGCGIRLYVDSHNVKAKKTYKSLGMRLAHYDMMEVDFTLTAH